MPRRLGSDTIIIQKATQVIDTRDNAVTYSYIDTYTVKGCSIQPYLMTQKFQIEVTYERDSSTTYFRLYVPWNDDTATLQDIDRIKFDGDVYEVHSLIGKWRDRDGRPNHIAVLIKRRTG